MTMTSLSAIIRYARAFRRLAPTALAEASAHALVAHHASDKIAAAARQADLHRPGRIPLPCSAVLRRRRTETCGCRALCHRWGRFSWCLQPGHRTLTRACALRGGTRHRALMRAYALRCLGGGSGNGRLECGSRPRFHRLRLHRHGHSGRRCGCVELTGSDRLRGDFGRVGRRRIDAVRDIGTHDQDRRDGSQKDLARPEQAPARLQRRDGERRLRHGCRDVHVACYCGRRLRVRGLQRWRCLGCGE